MPVAITMAKQAGWRSRAIGGRSRSNWAADIGNTRGVRSKRRHTTRFDDRSWIWTLNAVEIPQQSEIQQETDDAGSGGRPNDPFVVAEKGVHGGGEQPELEDHQNENDAKDAVDDRHPLLAGE